MWEDSKGAARTKRRPTLAAVLAGLAASGFGLSLAACQRTGRLIDDTGPRIIDATGPRITGDPPVSVGVEVRPEGSSPQAVAITELDVTTSAGLPTPVDTTCQGGGQDVILTLRSGRKIVYPFCAMPREIHAILNAVWAREGVTITGG